jgi:DNA polymerase-3 subunit delta'
MLKTLEEPPAYAVFLLLTENTQVFLPTIRSRCVTLRCKPVADERIREYLMKEHQVPDYQADLCVAFAQGEVGKAVRLAGSASFHERKALAVRQMERLAQTPLFSLADEIAQIEDLKTNAQAYLELLLYWFRDVLVYKAAGPDAGLIFSDAGAGIAKQARQYSWRGLSDCLEAVRRAQTRIRANVNAALTLELMLIEMRDALSKH